MRIVESETGKKKMEIESQSRREQEKEWSGILEWSALGGSRGDGGCCPERLKLAWAGNCGGLLWHTATEQKGRNGRVSQWGARGERRE